MTPDWSQDDHLSPDALAAYVDGSLAPDRRAEVEGHLAECPDCRGAALAATRYHAFKRRRLWLFGAGPLAAAAAIAAVVMVSGSDDAAPPSVLRGDTIEGVAAITPVHPGPGQVLDADRTFTWQGLGAGVPYRITVTDAVGREVWTEDTVDTTATMPDRIGLQENGVYFWRVGALLSDGRPAEMRSQEFRSAR